MNLTFKQILTRDKSVIIDIKVTSHITDISIDMFIKEYKISNLWKGKFFIKRLINKILKYRLNQKFRWDRNFWNKIKVSKLKIEINKQDSENVKLNIKNKTPLDRYSNIVKYQKLIAQNNKLGNPLYITGRTLNFLGASIEKDSVYILDGSRRLIANIQNNINPNILIIDFKATLALSNRLALLES